MIRVSVIVPARDAEATLPRTLAAIADQEGAPSFEVVVADDGSRDGTARVAERAGAGLVRTGGCGPARARNAAVASAGGSLLAFCDADVFPAPGWLAAGTRALGSADLVQGRVLPDPRSPLGAFDRSPRVTRETGLYDAAAGLFCTRELFERLGGFEDGPDEDVRFGWRARRDGARTAFCEEALAHHAASPREAGDYVAERRRLRRLPGLAAELPELRGTLMHRGVFLSSRTMKVDLALAGVAAAVARRSAAPLLAVAPYALELRRHARGRAREDWKRVAAVDAAADLAGAAALVRGSLEARTPVL